MDNDEITALIKKLTREDFNFLKELVDSLHELHEEASEVWRQYNRQLRVTPGLLLSDIIVVKSIDNAMWVR